MTEHNEDPQIERVADDAADEEAVTEPLATESKDEPAEHPEFEGPRRRPPRTCRTSRRAGSSYRDRAGSPRGQTASPRADRQ